MALQTIQEIKQKQRKLTNGERWINLKGKKRQKYFDLCQQLREAYRQHYQVEVASASSR